MPRLVDLLPEEQRRAIAAGSMQFDADVAGVLERDASRLSPEAQAKVAAALSERLPRLTREARAGTRARRQISEHVQRVTTPLPEPGGNEFVRGFSSGIAGSNVQAAGRVMSDVPLLGSVGRRIFEAGQKGTLRPRVADVSAVRSPSDAANFAQFSVGQGIASTIPILAGGLAGTVAGGMMAGPPGAAVGAVAGAAVPGYVMNTGSVLEETDKEGVSPAVGYALGVPITALDLINPVKWLSRFTGTGMEKQAARAIAQRIATGVAHGASTEALTEGAQEATQIGGVRAAGGKAEGAADRILNAAVGGGLTGGALGGASGAPSSRTRIEPIAAPPAPSQLPAARPVAAPPVAPATARPQVIPMPQHTASAEALAALRVNMSAPPSPSPTLAAAGEMATQRLMVAFARRATGGAPVSLPGVEAGTVVDVRVFPWEREQVRLNVRDNATGQIVPLRFRSIEDLAGALQASPPTQQAAVEAVGATTRTGIQASRLEAQLARTPKGAKERARLERRVAAAEERAAKSVGVVPQAVPKTLEATPPSVPPDGAPMVTPATAPPAASPPAAPAAAKLSEAHEALARAAWLSQQVAADRGDAMIVKAQLSRMQRPERDAVLSRMREIGAALTPDETRLGLRPAAVFGPPKSRAAAERVVGESKKAVAPTPSPADRQAAVPPGAIADPGGVGPPPPPKTVPKTPAAAPAPQQGLSVGAPVIPATPAGKPPTKAGADAVASMAGEAKSFADEFKARVLAGESHEEAAAEAARASGAEAPAGFEAEPRAKALLAEAARERGQGDMFGGQMFLGAPEKPAEKPVAVEPEPAAQPLERVAEAPPAEGRMRPTTIRSQTLRVHPSFQNKETGTHLVDDAKVQVLLDGKQGFSRDAIVAEPPTIWTDAKAELGTEGAPYVLSGHHRAYMARYQWDFDAAKAVPADWRATLGRDKGLWVATKEMDRDLPAVEFSGSLAEAKAEAAGSNRRGFTNTTRELAKLVREKMDGGEDVAKIATDLKIKPAHAKRLFEMSHVAKDVLDEFFPSGSEDKYLSLTHAEVVGSYARLYPGIVTPLVQREMSRDAFKYNSTASELKAEVSGFVDNTRAGSQVVMDALGNEVRVKTFSFGEYASILRPMRNELAHAKNRAKQAAQAFDEAASAAGVPAERRRILMEIRAEKTAELEALEKAKADLESMMLRAATDVNEGRVASLEVAANKALEFVRGVLGPAADRVKSESGFVDFGPLFGDFVRTLTKNSRKAADAALRRNAQALRMRRIDESGRVLRSAPIVKHTYDPLAEFATYRLLSNIGGFAGADGFLPERIRNRHVEALASESRFFEEFEGMLHDILGDAGMAYIEDGRQGGRELWRAMDGKPNNLRRDIADKLPQIRALFDVMWEMEAAAAAEMGMPKPPRRKNYMTHVRIGDYGEAAESMLTRMMRGNTRGESVDQISDRFLMERDGDDQVIESFMPAFHTRLRAAIRFSTHAPVVHQVVKYLDDVDARREPDEYMRAARVRDWAIASLLKRKGEVELMLDDALRRATVAVQPGLTRITAEDAGRALGREFDAKWGDPGAEEQRIAGQTSLEGEKGKLAGEYRYYAIAPAGKGIKTQIRLTAGKGSDFESLGKAGNGDTVVRVRLGHVVGMNEPRLNPAIEALRDLVESASLKFKANGPEARAVMRAKRAERTAAFIGSPARALSGATSGAVVRSTLGWNIRNAFQQLGQVITHTYPEVGIRSFLRGGARWTRAQWHIGLRKMIDAAERGGGLSKAEAAAHRSRISLMVEEILPSATGSQLGQLYRTRELYERLERGESELYAKMKELIGPMAPFQLSETYTRGFDMAALWDAGLRLGLSADEILDRATAHQGEINAMHRRVWGSVRRGEGAAAFAAMRSNYTMFSYNSRGHSPMHSGPINRIMWQLTHFALSNFIHGTLRPLEGAARVAAGAGRLAAHRVLGTKAPRPAPIGLHQNVGGLEGVFHRSLAQAGVTDWQRHASQVFVRKMMIYGVLAGLTDITGVNFMLFGADPVLMAAIGLMHWMFPDNEDLDRVAGLSAEAGIQKIPMGPLFSMAYDYDMAAGPATLTKGLVRRLLIPGDVEIRRLLKEHGDAEVPLTGGETLVDTAPWLYEFFDVKSTLADMTPADVLRHQTGLMRRSEEAERRQRVNP